jgi:hypothetical protein
MHIYEDMMVLKIMPKHLDETRYLHKEDFAELIRMNADTLVLKHHA